jgi:hypothetical protein
VTFAAEVTYIVPKDGLELLAFKVENGIMLELPQFPGLLCKVVAWHPKLKLTNYGIVQLIIEGFYKDDGT